MTLKFPLITKPLLATSALLIATLLLANVLGDSLVSATALPGAMDKGIALGYIANKSDAEISSEFAGIAKLGFTSVRTDFSWPMIQPNDATHYDWTTYDHIVSLAAQNNLQMLGILDYTPNWVKRTDCPHTNNCTAEFATQFADFAGTVAAHYKLQVNNWEIWNEENTRRGWGDTPDADTYTQLLKQSYQAIKQQNPTATVITGGIGTSNRGTIDPVTYLQQMYDAGAEGSFDAVGSHPYSFPAWATDADNAGWAKMDESSPSLRSVMEAHGDSAKQIWITEYGAPTDGPDDSGYVSETTQAIMALTAVKALQGKAWAGPFFWYTYQDSGTAKTTKENFFGMRRADGSPKPAYTIWQNLLAK